MLWLRKLVSDAEAYTSSLSGSVRPANRDRPSWMNFHLASAVAPGTRLVVAIAPEFTIGFVRPSAPRSIALERVERQPGGVHPDLLADLLGAEGLTDQGEHERLGDAHDAQRRTEGDDDNERQDRAHDHRHDDAGVALAVCRAAHCKERHDCAVMGQGVERSRAEHGDPVQQRRINAVLGCVRR